MAGKMGTPILTSELAERIEYSDFEVMSGRMRAIGRRNGNPYDVEFKEFGGATAIAARDLPSSFNKVWGFKPADSAYLDEMIAFYRERNPYFGIDLMPGGISTENAGMLHDRGFMQTGFHTAFYGIPLTPDYDRPEGVRIRLAGPEDAELFAEMFHRSLELPAGIAENAESFTFLLNDPNWRLYIGFADDAPAAFSMMYVAEDGVACFGMAGTIPAYRGGGLQTAMLARRMTDAASEGCRLVTAQAEFGTVSFRNLQKLGFRIAYTKAIWERKEGS